MNQKIRSLSERINWKQACIRAGIILILFLVCALGMQPKATDFSLHIELGEDRTGCSTQIFWWDAGKEAVQEQSFQAAICGKQVIIPLREEMLGRDKEWRLDIVDADLEVSILSFDLYKGDSFRKNFSADALASYEVGRAGIETACSAGGAYYIKPVGEDPAIFFGTGISRDIIRHMERSYQKELALVFLALCLLITADRLPGVRRITALLWKSKGRLGIAVLLTALWGIMALPHSEDYSLQIRLAEDRTGQHAQLFWWKQGEASAQEQSLQVPIYGRQILMPLERGILGRDTEWRLDIIDADMDVSIVSFDVYREHERSRRFSPDELEKYIISCAGVKNIGSTGEAYYIKPAGDDPVLYFGAGLSQSLRKDIACHYLMRLWMVFVVIFILAIGDRLPGLKSAYAFLWKYILQKKGRLAFAVLLTTAWGVITLPRSEDYSLQIALSEDRTGDYAQLYWWEEGEEFTHEQSCQAVIFGNQVVIPLQNGALGWDREWRLDPVNSDAAAEITALGLYRGHRQIRSFPANELESYMIRCEGVETAYCTEGGYFLTPLENDPAVFFGVRLSRTILEEVFAEYCLGLSLAALILLFLVTGDTLPGVGWIYAWIGRNRWRLAVMGLLFLVCAGALAPRYTDYTLKLELTEDHTGNITEIFWWNTGEGFTQEQFYQARIDGRRVSLPIQAGMLGWNKEWRLDIIAADKEVEISSFELYQGQRWSRAFSADELAACVVGSEGVEAVCSTGETYYVDPSGDDPVLYFGIRLSRAITEHIVTDYFLKLAAVVVPVFLVVMADRLPLLRRLYGWVKERAEDDRIALLCYGILLAGMIFVLFQDFLPGDRVFLYMGDSFYQTYAQLAHLADRIGNGEWGWSYTFYESLGNAEEPIILSLKNFCALFGREHLAYAMGLAQMLKIFLAGMFFYCFLRRLGTGKLGSSLLGLGYSCNSYIVARGMWQSYPNEAVCLALWLWGFERFKKTKKWLPFFLANIFCYWNYHGYTAVLYTGVGLAYGVFRFCSGREEAAEPGETENPLKCILKLTGIVLAGAAVSLAAWLPSLTEMLGSSRVSTGAQVAGEWKNILNYTRLPGYRIMFYRLLCPDILGMFEDTYAGVTNWLEDPVFYCGLAAVALAPLGLCAMNKRKRRWYMLPLAGAVIYNAFGVVRNVANGFAGIGWKLSSLWVIVLLLLFAAALWQEKEGIGADRAGKILLGTNIVLLVLSVLFFKEGIQIFYLAIALVFCAFLSLLLFLLMREKDGEKKAYLSYLLVIAAAAEVAGSSYRIINNKAGLNTEVLEEKIYYNDATGELLAKVGEEGEFYRVDKQFTSVSYCDSLYQRYRGTASYIGGVGDNDHTQRLYSCLGLPVMDHIQKGTKQNAAVNALFNVKYVLTKNQKPNTYGLEYLSEKDGIVLYENKHALPFGYVYDEYMTEGEFLEYNYVDRRNIMLEQCVIREGETGLLPEGVKAGGSYETFAEQWQAYRTAVSLDEKEIAFAPLEEGEVAILRVRMSAQEDARAEAYYMQGNVLQGSTDVTLVKGENDHYMEFMMAGTDRVPILANTRKPYEIAEAQLYVIPQEVYYADFAVLTEERSEGSLKLTHFEEERIEGSANLQKDGIMVFTIPYDEDWSAYVDGEEQELIHANVGFMALGLEAGSHEILLKYR